MMIPIKQLPSLALVCGLFLSVFLPTVQAGPANFINHYNINIKYSAKTTAVGLDEVSLWVSLDNGNQWDYYSAYPEDSNSIVFSAPEDGTYSFKTVAHSNTGKGEKNPVEGTPPDSTIIVDTIPPYVELVYPRREDVIVKKTLKIKWLLDEKYPSQKGISIELFSEMGDKIKTIARQLPDTGEYEWYVPDELNGTEAYLRITAVDRATNTHYDISDLALLFTTPPKPVDVAKLHNTNRGDLVKEKEYKLATIYRTRGDFNLALQNYHFLLTKYPQSEELYSDMGYTYYKSGRHGKALDIFNMLRNEHPKKSIYNRQLGVVYYAKHDLVNAEKYFRQSVLLNIFDENSYWYLSRIYLGAKKLNEARFCWKKIIRINKPNSMLVFQSKKLLDQTERTAKELNEKP